MRFRRSRRALQATLFVAIVSLIVPMQAAARDPLSKPAPRADGRSTAGVETKLSLPLSKAKGPQTVFVQFTKTSAADAAAAAQPAGAAAAKQAAKSARAAANRTSSSVVGELRTSDRKARELYRTSNAVTGVAVVADADSIRALAARTDVAKISVLVPKKLTNAHAAVLTRVLDTWQDLGLFGDHMRVGVIDTGIDYTHANFGGPGTPEAFDAIDPTDADGRVPDGQGHRRLGLRRRGLRRRIRTIRPCSPPFPTTTHSTATDTVRMSPGTAAGFGVNSDGSTFTGDYSALTAGSLASMRIGPGMAPKALLYALKIFGCPTGEAGSTFLTGAALDWTLDPNGDGNFSDHLDVVNISVGADYTTADDPENLITRNIIKHGVTPVFSAGNGGDFYDIGGGAPEALSVASVRDSFELLDAIEVTAPAAHRRQQARPVQRRPRLRRRQRDRARS